MSTLLSITVCSSCGGRIVVVSGPNGRYEFCEACRQWKKIP